MSSLLSELLNNFSVVNGNDWFRYRYAVTIGIGTRSKGTEISISPEISVSVVHYFSAHQNSLFSSNLWAEFSKVFSNEKAVEATLLKIKALFKNFFYIY